MAGSVKGGKKAAVTNKERFGENFYSEIGKIGGKASNTGGFYNNPELARRAGSIGGKKSKRTKNVV